MSSRSAEATIKGYYYQFDTSILKLLELEGENDRIHLERIEDVDVETATDVTAVQCKYLSKPRFVNSAVREPIELMLQHFIMSPKPDLKYVLYAHFTEEVGGTSLEINVERLKEILTYSEKKVKKALHLDNAIPDEQLVNFLSKFQFTFGIDFDVQQASVIKKIQAFLRCDHFEADTLHYNNALRLVIDRSCNPNVDERYISKREFYDVLYSPVILFNNWYVRLRSKNEYLKNVRQRFKSSRADLPSKSKLLIIGREILESDNTELPISMLIENLINKYYKLKHCLRDAKPLTIILELSVEEIKHIKKDLAASGHLYNDGYEDVHFNPQIFNETPVVNLSSNQQKLAKSSFVLKLVTKESYEQQFENMPLPKVVIHCSIKTCSYLRSNQFHLFDIKHCTTLSDISTILI